MDPTQTLKELRKDFAVLMEQLKESEVSGNPIYIDEESLMETVSKFEYLDRWLQGGGFLPDDWKK